MYLLTWGVLVVNSSTKLSVYNFLIIWFRKNEADALSVGLSCSCRSCLTVRLIVHLRHSLLRCLIKAANQSYYLTVNSFTSRVWTSHDCLGNNLNVLFEIDCIFIEYYSNPYIVRKNFVKSNFLTTTIYQMHEQYHYNGF